LVERAPPTTVSGKERKAASAGPDRFRSPRVPAGGAAMAGPIQLRGVSGLLDRAADGVAGRSSPLPEGPNRSGLPDRLKAGAEALSGFSLDDVRVHRNSPEPAKLGAVAYASGGEIHLGPGQEAHLPHEAWHVVQQKQGRVRPTLQMKGGKHLNDDPRLEHEADVMGARAAAIGPATHRAGRSAPFAGPAAHAAAPIRARIVQRYKVAGDYHLANDDTAAVGTRSNNKELYATPARIGQANAALKQSISNISFTTGTTTIIGGHELARASPTLDRPSVLENARGDRALTSEFHPRLDPASKTRVELPSECEKGAMAVIGAHIQEERIAENEFDYPRPQHAKSRIANLIAQSGVKAEKKASWYDGWVRLTDRIATADLIMEAVKDEPRAVPIGADIAELRDEIATIDAQLATVQFDEQFKPRQDHFECPDPDAALAILAKMVRLLFAKVNAIEHEVMGEIDATYLGYDRDVLAAEHLRDALISLYAAHDFPVATIKKALELAGQQENLSQYFAVKPGDQSNYVSNLSIFKDRRMRAFLKRLVAAIGGNIIALEERRNRRFGTVGDEAARNPGELVDPEIGQAYGIIGGQFSLGGGGRWNWHWAGVVLKTGTDNVTMEAHASQKLEDESHNERWDFKMYGRPAGQAGTTFHETWRTQGFGQAPVTVLGKPSVAPDREVREFQLVGLAPDVLDLYWERATKLYNIEKALMNPPGRPDDIRGLYYRGAEIIDAGLPPQFVQRRLGPLQSRQAAAVLGLEQADPAAGVPDQQKQAITDSARAMVTELKSLLLAIINRKHAQKKTGALP
jgi:hypothetical protein